ncbi:MAG TPA: hypothetical protein VGS18_03430 [Thermoplasmata archaeon]|nr:hypothetical protein [Thermoplasmata archaeon]
MLLLAIAVSLGALLGTIASALPATAVTAGPGASPGAAWSLAGAGLNTSLTISSTPIELASGFWGTTISSRVPLFANESYLVNATQDRTVVWPGANAGDQYDPFTNLTWTDGNQATLALTTEVQFINWCRTVHCNAIFEAPGEIDNPQLAAALVNYTEKTLAFHPVAWEIGNEPGFWNHWGQPWGTWTSKTTAPTSTQYAWEVWNYERAMRLADPTISIIGLPGVGKTLSGDSIAHWISQVIKVDGPNISAIAIHVYPDLSTQNDTLAQFYHTLAKSNIQSIPARVPALRSAIAADIRRAPAAAPSRSSSRRSARRSPAGRMRTATRRSTRGPSTWRPKSRRRWATTSRTSIRTPRSSARRTRGSLRRGSATRSTSSRARSRAGSGAKPTR